MNDATIHVGPGGPGDEPHVGFAEDETWLRVVSRRRLRRKRALSKSRAAEARRLARQPQGWSAPIKRRRRSAAFRDGPRLRRVAAMTPERREWHRARSAAYAALPPCRDLRRPRVAARRSKLGDGTRVLLPRTDGKGRGRSPWRGRLGTLVGR